MHASQPSDELRLDRELVGGALDGLAGHGLRDPGQLEHDPSGLHHRHPEFGVPLTRAHAGLGRLLRHRLVRKDVDPHLPAAADVPRHGHPRRLDLPVADPPRLHGHQAVVAEVHVGAPLGLATHPAPLLLPMLHLLRLQHHASPSVFSASPSATEPPPVPEEGPEGSAASPVGSVGSSDIFSLGAGASSSAVPRGAAEASRSSRSGADTSASSFVSVINAPVEAPVGPWTGYPAMARARARSVSTSSEGISSPW